MTYISGIKIASYTILKLLFLKENFFVKIKSIFALAVVTASAFAGSVQASPVWTVSFHGIISYGYDSAGIFGTANQDLAGLEYTQTITASVDPNQYPGIYNYPNFISMFGNAAPFMDTVTVNGKTISFNIVNPENSEQTIANGASSNIALAYDEINTVDSGYDSTYTKYLFAFNGAYTNDKNSAFVPTPDFGQTINKAIEPGVDAFSYFTLNSNGGNDATFYATADSIMVNVSADVPEPASIALFGFGLLGMSVLRRRKATSLKPKLSIPGPHLRILL